jgi:hypothetical protein
MRGNLGLNGYRKVPMRIAEAGITVQGEKKASKGGAQWAH